MRVMVALEDRFYKTRNGNIYSNTISDYAFWSAYLQVFDEVVVFARLDEVLEKEPDRPRANGPNVSFYGLPYYVGPWQYLKQQHKIKALAKRATTEAEAFILRIPGRISTLLWHYLMRKRTPYGVEVIGDSLGSAKTSGANILLQALLKKIELGNQRRQCHYAAVAAYITETYLQSLYPSGGWSTYWSDVNLPANAIVNDNKLQERFASLNGAVGGQRPFRICHIGTMAALYKAQDVLMEAISICRAKGLDIHLVLLGDGKYRQYFVEKAKALGLSSHVKFLGQLPAGRAVINQLDAADLFVFPSLTEAQGKVLIEAMARGLPCLASKVGGIPELLADEDLVAPGDATALAAKIESVLNEPNRVMQMSRRNLQTAQRYRLDILNERRVESYKKLVEETKLWYANKNKSRS